MITAINGNNYSNARCFGLMQQNKSNNIQHSNIMMSDSVSFTGGAKSIAKLSNESTELVQKFAKGLKLNKLYKIDTPVEKVRIASVATPQSSEERSLFIQYSSYSKDNLGKYLMFSVNGSGEVYENGTKLKQSKNLALYETMLPKLINMASKEFHMNLK